MPSLVIASDTTRAFWDAFNGWIQMCVIGRGFRCSISVAVLYGTGIPPQQVSSCVGALGGCEPQIVCLAESSRWAVALSDGGTLFISIE